MAQTNRELNMITSPFNDLLHGIFAIITEAIAQPLVIKTVESRDSSLHKPVIDPNRLTFESRASEIVKTELIKSTIDHWLTPFKSLHAKQVIVCGEHPLKTELLQYLCDQNVRQVTVLTVSPDSYSHPNDQVIYRSLNDWESFEADFFIQLSPVQLKSQSFKEAKTHINKYRGIADLTSWLPYNEQKDHRQFVVNHYTFWICWLLSALELWQGKKIPGPLKRKIYHELLVADPENDAIYLVGLPAVGKSSVGRELAKKLGYSFVDLDKMMISRSGHSITEMFDFDEARFRRFETKCLKELSGHQRTIISTGNGVVLSPYNRRLLEKAFVIHLDRPQELMNYGISTRNRPLLRGNPGLVKQLRKDRFFYYHSVSNCRVVNYKRHRTAAIITRLLKKRLQIHRELHQALLRLAINEQSGQKETNAKM